HTQAIAQCQHFIHKHMPQATVMYSNSTGSAAEEVSQNGAPIAAIGNKLAAKEYGLNILQKDIHDFPNNHTRFFVLTKNPDSVQIKAPVAKERTSIIVHLPKDRAGVLHQVLSAFA